MLPMKRTELLALIILMVLAAGMMAAGCVSGGGNTGQAANTPAGSAGAAPQQQYRGTGFLSNETRISEAAAKLGVSEDALREALNSTAGGRPNLTAAADQLGVTPQQLMDALGIPAGGYPHRGGGNSTSYSPAPVPS
jgi:hypothetical protein